MTTVGHQREATKKSLSGNDAARPQVSPRLAEHLEQETRWQRQRALRALLQHPLLTADGPFATEFGLVRRHAEWLRDWLAHYPGWTLTVDSELARLRKTPADSSEGDRPARDTKTGVPFSRRRYVLLCLALAVLEQEDRQTTLGQLANRVVALCAADDAIAAAGVGFDLNSLDQRRDLVQVVRVLLEMRILRRLNGDEEQFLSQRGDALYNISRPALAAMLSVKRGPSTIAELALADRVAAITEEPAPDTDEGRNRKLRSSLMRKLLDDPVVYYDSLQPAEFDYLNSQRGRLLQQIEDATGLVPEVRREGIAMLDIRGDMTDLGLPEEGTDGHLTLLVAQFLADQLRRNRPTVGEAALTQHVAGLVEEHKAHWRRDVTQAGAVESLTRQTVERLESLGLVRRISGGIRPLWAIARYALGECADNEAP
ncbi:MAG: TIGR02678 family protein [Planctomycetes bacterium]|nr:TIGR02678 family protein [Planctomycetota bacterium]